MRTQVTTNDVRLMTDKLQSVLLFNLPSGAGFTGGLYYGLGGTAAGAGATTHSVPAPLAVSSEWPFAVQMVPITESHASPPGDFLSAFDRGYPIEPSVETISRVHTQTSGARGMFQRVPLWVSRVALSGSTAC